MTAHHARVVGHVGRGRHGSELSCLTWRGHCTRGLSEPIGGWLLLSWSVHVVVGPVHGLGFDPRHDGMSLELPDLLPQIPVRPLSIFIGVEGDVPTVVVSVLTRGNLGTGGSGKQILN